MTNYYHATPTCCLDSILERGLIPFSKLEKELPPEEWSKIRPRISASVMSDNDFVCFHKKPPALGKTESIVIINLPDGFPIERDYDQFLYQLKLYDGSLNETPRHYQIAMSMVFDFERYPDLESLRDYYKEKFKYHSVKFSGKLTPKNIMRCVDMIGEESWQSLEFGGSYRTKNRIKPNCIAVYYTPPKFLV